jgi:hypothetical protein
VKRRLFASVALLSLLLCVLLLVLWPVTYSHNTVSGLSLRISNDVRVATFEGQLSVFNAGRPYTGGIISVAAGGAPPSRPAWPQMSIWPQVSSFDCLGLYFWHLRWPGKSYWTFRLTIIYPILLTALIPTLWLFMRRRGATRGFCGHCGYDLRATPDRCPECGTVPEKVAGASG